MAILRARAQSYPLIMLNTLPHFNNLAIPIDDIKRCQHIPIPLNPQRHLLIVLRLRILRRRIPQRKAEVPHSRCAPDPTRSTTPQIRSIITPSTAAAPRQRHSPQIAQRQPPMQLEQRQSRRIAKLTTAPFAVVAARHGELCLLYTSDAADERPRV